MTFQLACDRLRRLLQLASLAVAGLRRLLRSLLLASDASCGRLRSLAHDQTAHKQRRKKKGGSPAEVLPI